MSVGYFNFDSSPDLLAGGMDKLWEGPIGSWPNTEDSAELYPSPWGDGYDNGQCNVNLSSIRIVGEVPGDPFGYSVAFVGDIAGTSGEDFVVGAPRRFYVTSNPLLNGEPWTERGSVYFFHATTPYSLPDTPSASLVNASLADLIIEGEVDGDRFGYTVSAAGDWNGDGKPDFAVGAPGAWQSVVEGEEEDPQDNMLSPGMVYVISGQLVLDKVNAYNQGQGPQSVSVMDVVLRTTGGTPYVWTGSTNGDRFGYHIAFVQGLGSASTGTFDALVVGAPQFVYDFTVIWGGEGKYHSFGHGYVAVISGAPGDPVITIPYSQVDGTPPSSPLDDVWFGHSVGGPVDIDDDGYSEILVGAPNWDAEVDARDLGKAIVIDPVGATPTVKRSHEGAHPDEFFGYSVVAIGNYEDLPVSAENGNYAVGSRSYFAAIDDPVCTPCSIANSGNSSGGGRIAGRTVIFGEEEERPIALFFGEDPRDSAGWGIVAIPDVTGALSGDFLIGGFRWGDSTTSSPVVSERGRVYYFPRLQAP